MENVVKGASATHWTDPQRLAIEHGGGDLLVSAAAGSGKTAVLAERCARLVCQGAAVAGEVCGIENLLVLTFTEAAAGEMRSRIAAAIHARVRQGAGSAGAENLRRLRRQAAMVDRAGISTLHAFCMRTLRQHFHEAGVDPAFEVIDPEEARLLQEEVLDDLLARWHRLPENGAGLNGARFADFFEAYAQGRESTCREMILLLQRMLASTADPKKYIEDARQVYAEGGGAEATLRDYVTQFLAGKLRIAEIAARRACAEVARFEGTEKMRQGLESAAQALEEASAALAREGAAAMMHVRNLLAYKWPRLNAVKEIDGFEGLKQRTWQLVKNIFEKLNEDFSDDPAVMLRDLLSRAAPLDTLLAMAGEFDDAFTAAKRAENRLDFNDLERLALELLTRPGNHAVQELRRRYRYLLVDEFQDINPLQAALLDAVRDPAGFSGAGNLFVVGDVKQSIYGFRLAEPGLFARRELDARDAAGGQKFVALPHNFRSQPKLIGVMNGIFERLLTNEVAGVHYTHGHALEPGRQAEASTGGGMLPLEGAPVEVHLIAGDRAEEEAPEDDSQNGREEGEGAREAALEGEREKGPSENLTAVEHEAQMVAERIAALLAEGRGIREKDGTLRRIACRDIAILLRTMKHKAMIFARALAARGIPVHADLSTGYFDTREVQDALALLQVLDNAQQDIPLATALLGPYGRFTHDDLARIRLTFDRREVAFAAAVAGYAQQNANRSAAGPEITPLIAPGAPPHSADLADRLREFFDTLARWRQKLRSRPLHEGLAEIFSESRILAYLAGLDAGAQRIANLQMLHQRALKFAGFRKQGLHRFLRYIERLAEDGGDLGEAPVLSEASDVVRVMSIHKAKGLEFPVVFVSGLGGKLRLDSPGPILVHRDLGVGLHVVDVERNIVYPSVASLRIAEAQRRSLRAEELRLLYVAMTRARDHLVLTGHIGKESAVENWRNAWREHPGPLPEDVLLKGFKALDWIMPAIATGRDAAAVAAPGRLSVNWNGPIRGDEQVVVTLHAPQQETASLAPSQAPDPSLAVILAGEPLPQAPEADERIARLQHRITGLYAHEALTRQPAVQTVTFLKTLPGAQPINDETEPAPATAGIGLLAENESARDAAAQAARLRGIATHRILELLAPADCRSQAAIDAQIARLVDTKRLSQTETDQADLIGIHWFLLTSAAGRRLITACQRAAVAESTFAEPALIVRREIPFAWAAPLDASAAGGSDPADWPTIRGVLDVLIADTAARTAEILDYKTDSAFLWESRLDDYRRQMAYYLRAASDILGFRVEKATLIFLSPRREIEVRSSQ